MRFDRVYDGLKQRAARITDATFFARTAEWLAREAARQQIVGGNARRKTVNIAFLDLAGAKPGAIDRASLFTDVVCPQGVEHNRIGGPAESADTCKKLYGVHASCVPMRHGSFIDDPRSGIPE